MNVAKINKKTNVVENLEVVSKEWLQKNIDDEYLYIPYDSNNQAHIGFLWSSNLGFEQPMPGTDWVLQNNIWINPEEPYSWSGSSTMGKLICEAFPKTASTWLLKSLQLSFPEYVAIRAQHRVSNLKDQFNVITTIRDPRNCIPSYMIFFEEESMDVAVDFYCQFLNTTKEYSEKIFICSFDQIINNTHEVLKKYSEKFLLQHPIPVSYEEIMIKMEKEYTDFLPKNKTEKRLQLEETIHKNKRIEEAIYLYEEVLKLTEHYS